jgi:triosephosphate isomerase
MKKPRGVLIAGNWKMNNGPDASRKFFNELSLAPEARSLFAHNSLRAWIFPPYISLEAAKKAAGSLTFPIEIGAQNAFWEKSGAFTGEISGPMLQELGVLKALVGHSERRQFFGETDTTVQKRARGLLAQGFQVILCVGETREEREKGATFEVLNRQLQAALVQGAESCSEFLDGRLILAYEPVWAIGTGLTAKPEQAEEAHQMIRKFLWDHFGMESAGRTPILYGGSVTPENATSLLSCPNVDGALVGGASLKPDAFLALLKAGAGALLG